MSAPELPHAESAARLFRARRSYMAARLRAARRAMQAGEGHVTDRHLLAAYRRTTDLNGHQCPNPDRAAACLRFAQRAREVQVQVEALPKDHPHRAATLHKLRADHALFMHLAQTARY
jgi:hypothetical protein